MESQGIFETHPNPMKRMISLALVLACLLIMAAPAYASWSSGTVSVSTWLNVRKEPADDATIIGYLKNGDKVEVWERFPSGYLKIYGPISSTHPEASSISEVAFDVDNEINAVRKMGYVAAKYIKQ